MVGYSQVGPKRASRRSAAMSPRTSGPEYLPVSSSSVRNSAEPSRKPCHRSSLSIDNKPEFCKRLLIANNRRLSGHFRPRIARTTPQYSHTTYRPSTQCLVRIRPVSVGRIVSRDLMLILTVEVFGACVQPEAMCLQTFLLHESRCNRRNMRLRIAQCGGCCVNRVRA